MSTYLALFPFHTLSISFFLHRDFGLCNCHRHVVVFFFLCWWGHDGDLVQYGPAEDCISRTDLQQYNWVHMSSELCWCGRKSIVVQVCRKLCYRNGDW
jgi:hypothetical protein